MVGREQWMTGDSAQPCIWRAKLGVFCIAGKGYEGRSSLIPQNTAKLPTTQYLVDDSALVQELLSFANGEFIEIAEHEGVRNVLVAQSLL